VFDIFQKGDYSGAKTKENFDFNYKLIKINHILIKKGGKLKGDVGGIYSLSDLMRSFDRA